MAQPAANQHQILSTAGVNVVDRQRANSGSQSEDSTNLAASFIDMASLDAALAAVDASYYNAARLRQLTLNDKTYALRLASYGTTI